MKHGAEAEVEIGEDVRKNRVEKNYRHGELDERIRKERNKKEVRMLEEARQNGVNVPKVLEKSETEFRMQKVDGDVLKDVLEENPELIKELAEQVARLHQADIIHGDLTTSNAICTGEKISIIDFGLSYRSERLEDKAVDIHLLKQVLAASHGKNLWEKFEESYREQGDEKVVEKVPEIEERARYK